MKCKIFEGSDKELLQQRLNNWLSSNDEKIKISRILQSTASYIVVISIWYYELPEEKKKSYKHEFDGIEVI